MWILLEWLIAFILFCCSVSNFDININRTSHYYYYDSVPIHDEKNFILGLIYLIGCIIFAVMAFIHTKIIEYDNDYYPYRIRNDNITNYSYSNTTPIIYTSKTQNEVISDITKNYLVSNTNITHITKHAFKKAHFFALKKEKEEISVFIPPQKSKEKEENTNTIVEVEISKSLNKAMNKYVCYDDIKEINACLIFSEYTEDFVINVFYEPSPILDVAKALNKYTIVNEMKKDFQPLEDVKFIEITDGMKFDDFYKEFKNS